MADKLKVITKDELAKHNKSSDCWMSIHGKVYDLTKFSAEHPGGPEVLHQIAGDDGSTDFDDIGHSRGARREAEQYVVGILEGWEVKDALGTLKEPIDLSTGDPKSSSILVPLLVLALAIATYVYVTS